ncbi:MAG: transcription-repair coupling factor, partial [Alphaproteobacteria bacterium]|nr:transcription-repair coupling factor [Alphaproteobacteria bacterium]
MDAALVANARTTSVNRPILHVARDDLRMARMAAMLKFAVPELPVFSVPAWDCLPYDRVSPNAQIVAARLDALTRLAGGGTASPVVLTTVSAVLQRLPPRATLAEATLSARVGEDISQKRLMDFLSHNGYHRAGTVREAGEYAIRGGIVDLFPPGEEEPLRLDFFGDELETVRRFDAMTQRTTGNEESFVLRPVSETPLSENSIQRFRHAYRAQFGAANDTDPLYEAVSAGQRHIGMEHWLPLFHDHMETLFDYLPGAAVTLDHQVDEAVTARQDLIAEYYEARRAMLPSTQRGAQNAAVTTDVYKPVTPESMFLTAEEWRDALDTRPVVAFSPFALPDSQPGMVDAGGRRAQDFTEIRATPDIQLFDAVHDRLASESKARTVLIAAYSVGSRDRLAALLGEHGVSPIVNVGDWREAMALPRGAVGMAVVELESGFSLETVTVYSEQDILGER